MVAEEAGSEGSSEGDEGGCPCLGLLLVGAVFVLLLCEYAPYVVFWAKVRPSTPI